MAVFGTEVWLARGELFTVVARTLARFAAVELYAAPRGRLQGESLRRGGARQLPVLLARCRSEKTAACASTYGSGVRREPMLGTGGGTFVLALLATVVYDGFSQTQKYVDLES